MIQGALDNSTGEVTATRAHGGMKMQWIGIAFAVVGLALLLFGFAKNSRYILVVGGIALFLGGAFPDFARGYLEGYNGTRGQPSETRQPSR